MKSINILYSIIKLNLKEVKIERFKEEEKRFVFTIKGVKEGCRCTKCGENNKKRKDLKEYKRKYFLKHIFLSYGKMIELEVIRRYYKCGKCGKEYIEIFSFDTQRGKHTKEFEKYVIYGRGHMSGAQIGKDTLCSPYKIHKILSKIDPQKINKEGIKIMKSLDKIYLGIDEHSFRGKDMILVIVELKEKKPIAVLENITVSKLDSWIKSLPEEIRKKIVGISTDMNKGYKNVFENNIKNVLSTVDKYHLVQEANRVVDEVRQLNNRLIQQKIVKEDEIIRYGKIPKNIMKQKEIKRIKEKIKSNKYKEKINNLIKEEYILKEDLKDYKGRKVEYKEITLEYFINTGYRRIFLKREINLSGIQKLRLRQIFKEFDYKGFVAEARVAKERFITALDDLDINEIVDIMKDCLTSEHYRIRTFGRTLKRWMKQLETYCKYSTEEFKFTNAYTESFNNQCKVAKRVSHGFKYKASYFRKLSSRFYNRNTNLSIGGKSHKRK